ncbi:hypothetical protein [Microcystis aeruginosa]|jgi:hypothetical protein|uniref:Uncharacterized protein n=1 Tax=Microcystis aeruginosa NIES-298 TaxID=449468 RepID=A0A2H6BRI0_MICAE|nr:hypothetical protein [Microcystis aeruginosa]WOB67191.1 hypothetical protein PJW00_16515 [Microcystis aeruginosa LE3]GBD52771.1 hypothetical protein BGM30_18640 [Microcystis aeruginosa NIES-298]GBF00449.1 hypothetical protein NIES298_46950 [Microcystis aeruginosa NIES-298]
MAVMADKEKMFAKSAFFIPTNVLLKAWNKLLDIAQVEGRIPKIIPSIKCIFENKNYQDQLNTAYENLVIEVRDHLREAIILTASRKEGGFSGGGLFL